MSFQDFCSKAYEIDKQIVETSDSFVIHFKKETGTAFTVDPNDIIEFLRFLVLNHNDCVSAIQDDERFSKESYLNYDEKPYRALYRLTANYPELKAISSLGGSQTKELTKVISKLICYLANIDYVKVEEDTHFDLDSINLALKNIPEDIRDISQKNLVEKPIHRRKLFFNWLLKQGKKERTARSYSVTVLNVANSTLAEITSPFDFDLVNNPDDVYELHEKLKKVESWVSRNDSGGGMYDAGLNSYRDFVSEINQSAVIAMLENPGLTLSKPFLLLAGISGTGKSRFVRQQAAAQGSEQELFQLVPVRPDWHEPSDLLGYVSRINGSPKFVVTDALRFMVRAWKATGAEVVALPNGKTGWWSAKRLDEINTYWLCLDEMNLAPVEQYFADYLSVIESRHWLDGEELADSGNDFVYHCLPILPASSLVAAHDQTELAKDLGLDIQNNQADAQLWESFTTHGIPVPFNLVVAGTVNMDETTHGFSRKVIDRALTIDFGRFFPNDFNQLWVPETKPKTLRFSRLSHASKEAMVNCPADFDGQKTIQFLQAVNKVLTDTPFELAYRALNELLLAVTCHNPQTEQELQAVWDDFLMCKVLPRIEGDDEKLAVTTSNTTETLLDALAKQLSASFAQIWTTQRPDLLRENIASNTPLTVPCRSKAKLEWMKNRLERNSFTSFWP